jgi:hypothetical protein
LVMAVTCVPMPPDFFDLPERQMMLPFIGRLPVNSQMRDIKFFQLKGRTEWPAARAKARTFFLNFFVSAPRICSIGADDAITRRAAVRAASLFPTALELVVHGGGAGAGRRRADSSAEFPA